MSAVIISLLINNSYKRYSTSISALIIFWIIMLLFYCFFSPAITFAIIYISVLSFVPLAIFSGFSSRNSAVLLFKSLNSIALLVAVCCLFQFAVTKDRANFTVIDPNFIGAILGFFFVAGSIFFLADYKVGRKSDFMPLLLLSSGMAATQSRSVLFLSICAILFIYSCFKGISYKKRLLAFLYIMLLIIMAWLLVSFMSYLGGADSIILERIGSGGSSLSARFEIWGAALNMFKQSPFVGLGLGGFLSYYPDYRNEMYTVGTFAHNDYLQMFAEGGVFLGGLYLSLLCVYVFLLYKNIRNYNLERIDNSNLYLIGFQTGGFLLLLQAGVNFTLYLTASSLLIALSFSAMFTQYESKKRKDKKISHISASVKLNKLTRIVAIIFALVVIVIHCSIFYSSHISHQSLMLTRSFKSLSQDNIEHLEELLEFNQFIHRPVVPLAEDALILAEKELSPNQKKELAIRLYRYYIISIRHANLHCIEMFLAAELSEISQDNHKLSNNLSKKEMLQNGFDKLPRCKIYYEFILGKNISI